MYYWVAAGEYLILYVQGDQTVKISLLCSENLLDHDIQDNLSEEDTILQHFLEVEAVYHTP